MSSHWEDLQNIFQEIQRSADASVMQPPAKTDVRSVRVTFITQSFCHVELISVKIIMSQNIMCNFCSDAGC